MSVGGGSVLDFFFASFDIGAIVYLSETWSLEFDGGVKYSHTTGTSRTFVHQVLRALQPSIARRLKLVCRAVAYVWRILSTSSLVLKDSPIC